MTTEPPAPIRLLRTSHPQRESHAFFPLSGCSCWECGGSAECRATAATILCGHLSMICRPILAAMAKNLSKRLMWIGTPKRAPVLAGHFHRAGLLAMPLSTHHRLLPDLPRRAASLQRSWYREDAIAARDCSCAGLVPTGRLLHLQWRPPYQGQCHRQNGL